MTNASPTGEPIGAPAANEAEARLLAAQVELIMAVPPLVMAVRVLEASFEATERAIAGTPAGASAEEIRKAHDDHAMLLRLYLQALSRHATNLRRLANDLVVAAELEFHWPD